MAVATHAMVTWSELLASAAHLYRQHPLDAARSEQVQRTSFPHLFPHFGSH